MQRIQKWAIPHTLTCIIISSDRLSHLPEDGELSDITTIEGKYSHNNVRHQITIDFVYTYEGYLHSAAQLHELNKHVKENVKKVVQDILEENKGECYYKQTTNKKYSLVNKRQNSRVWIHNPTFCFTRFPYNCSGDFNTNRWLLK